MNSIKTKALQSHGNNLDVGTIPSCVVAPTKGDETKNTKKGPEREGRSMNKKEVNHYDLPEGNLNTCLDSN